MAAAALVAALLSAAPRGREPHGPPATQTAGGTDRARAAPTRPPPSSGRVNAKVRSLAAAGVTVESGPTIYGREFGVALSVTRAINLTVTLRGGRDLLRTWRYRDLRRGYHPLIRSFRGGRLPYRAAISARTRNGTARTTFRVPAKPALAPELDPFPPNGPGDPPHELVLSRNRVPARAQPGTVVGRVLAIYTNRSSYQYKFRLTPGHGDEDNVFPRSPTPTR